MARNQIALSAVINDFLLMHRDDSYCNNADEFQVEVLAKRGLREIGFDVAPIIKSIRLDVDTSNMTVPLPNDYVDYVRIGTTKEDGLFYTFVKAPNLSAPQTYTEDGNGDPVDSDGDGVYDRTDAKEAPANTPIQEDYYYSAGRPMNVYGGARYGISGAKRDGYFRINREQNRIEISSPFNFSVLDIEYIADEALSANTIVHPYCVEALDNYIYYKFIERSNEAPINEKVRAERSWLKSLKRANSRMVGFSKQEFLDTIRSNSQFIKY